MRSSHLDMILCIFLVLSEALGTFHCTVDTEKKNIFYHHHQRWNANNKNNKTQIH